MKIIRMQVRPGRNGYYGGAVHGPGAICEMTDAEAAEVLKSGDWQPVRKPDDDRAAGQSAPATERPEAHALTTAIQKAIEGLDPGKDFISDGRPNVQSLEKALGYDITAAERDEAWKAVKRPRGGGGDSGVVDAVDARFNDPNLAEDAVYKPAGGAPRPDPVRVIRVPVDQVQDFDGTRIAAGGYHLDVRASEVPTPQDGDTYEFAGVTRRQKGAAVHPPGDPRGLIWRIDSAPVD